MQELCIGAEYEIKAEYKCDKKYGHQYVPNTIYALIPQSYETQLAFLKSIIPENIADNLIQSYPNIVNDIANGTLTEIDYDKVKGVREVTWERIKQKIFKNYIISDIILLLNPLGVTFTMIKSLLKDQPNPVLLKQEIVKNPYVITRVDGIGFKKCDELALKLKPELIDSDERLTAFIVYYLKKVGNDDGDTWVSQKALEDEVSNNVPDCINRLKPLLSNNSFLYQNDNKIGILFYEKVEREILDTIKYKSKINSSQWFTEEQINKAIHDSEKEQGFTYTEEQAIIIKKSLNSHVSIITGKAGVGKTSIIRAIIKAYTQNNKTVSACALSAMAAQRITEATNFPASTIHRALGCCGLNKFEYNKDNQLLTDVAFMDEGSMVNASLFLNWIQAIGDNTRVIIAGDHKQLPPIGYGNIFSDLIDVLDKSNVFQLTKPMRQAQMSGILSDANLIRENKNPIIETIQPKLIHGELKDMYYMFRSDRDNIFNTAMKLYLSAIKADGIDNVSIAVPRRQGCKNCSIEFNKAIQSVILKDENQSISNNIMEYKLGAKVMQTVNDYQKNIFNGEIGYITKIDEETKNKKNVKRCEVTFKDMFGETKIISYELKELIQLDLAYALSVHKLQGGSRKTIIGVIDNTHYQLLDNCMLYTLLTRAKGRCCLVAEPQAYMKCITNSHNNRNTWMKIIEEGERDE